MQPLAIGVLINGKGPFRFVVDTGADRTVLSDDVAAALGLLRGSDVMVEGIIRTVPAHTVPIHELAVGPVTRESLNLPVLPRSMVRADGYLGLDVIGRSRITFDFEKHALEIDEAVTHALSGSHQGYQARVPAIGTSGHLRSVDCRADNIRSTAFIDSGAEFTVGNRALGDALVSDNPKYASTEFVPITGLTGGTITGRVATLQLVRLHGLRFAKCQIAIAPLPIFDLWGLADTPALLIGMNWLREFVRVSIDYRNEELRFDLASAFMARDGKTGTEPRWYWDH